MEDVVQIANYGHSIAGGTFGLIGGAMTSLLRPLSKREAAGCLLGGLALGVIGSNMASERFSVTIWEGAGIGLVLGVCVLVLHAMIIRFAERWAQKPTFNLQETLRNASDPPPPPPPPTSPGDPP